MSNDALSAFLDRYVGFDDDETAVAQTQLLADHPHDASQISGTFPNVSVAGDIWSTSWNGAVPADLSSVADPDATTGFYLDSSAGAIQAFSIFGTSEQSAIGALWFTAIAPAGWVLCDGTSYATGDLPAVFAIIGYDYGGSGANFNVPDMRGMFPFMQAAAGTGSGALGTTFGGIDHAHTIAHTHTISHTHTHAHTHTLSHTHSMQGHTHFVSDTTSGPSTGSTAGPSATLTVQAGSGALTAHSGHSHSMQGHTHATSDTSGGPSSGSTGGASTTTTSGASGDTTSGSSAANTGASSAANSGTGNPPGFVVNIIIKT